MAHQVIISRGRIADRTPGAIGGAVLLGRALATRLECEPVECGRPEPARVDDYASALRAAEPNLRELAHAVSTAAGHGKVPLVAGNKCPVALATVPVAAANNRDLVVVWLDAHGDFHTPATTASGYLGGMVLSAVCGLWDSGHGAGVEPRNVVLVGARAIDPPEQALLEGAGVTVLAPEESTPERLAAFVGPRPVWVHLDLDVLEPGIVPLDYEVGGGLDAAQVSAILAALEPSNIVGAEVMEFESPLDPARVHTATALDAVSPGTRTAASISSVLSMLEPLLPARGG